MTSATYRSDQPLFTVIVRDTDARNLLTRWCQTSRRIAARVEDNHMHLFDHNSLSMFLVTWTHGWDSVMIWDPWAKRHINI